MTVMHPVIVSLETLVGGKSAICTRCREQFPADVIEEGEWYAARKPEPGERKCSPTGPPPMGRTYESKGIK